MCLSPKVDRSIQAQQQQEAAEARAREEARQARIREGTAKIETQFGQFDDDFFAQRRAAYNDYYQPQLEDKFKNAQEKLTFALARAGTLNSTLAAERNADLLRDLDVQRATINSKAENDVNQFRGRIQNEKSALVSQLNATSDADRASNEALARTQYLQQNTPEYSPLGDIFLGVASGIGNYLAGREDAAILSAGGVSGRSPRRSSLNMVN